MANNKRVRRVLACVLVFALVLGLSFVPKRQVEAAAKGGMKGLKVKWDLKKNKKVNYRSIYAGIGKQKQTVKMTNLKKGEANEEGYKKLTFTLTFSHGFKPTAKQVHKMANSKYCKRTGSIGGGIWFSIVDYDTGVSLEGDNEFGVRVEAKWSHKKNGKGKYKDKEGCYVVLRKSIAKVSITYPDEYEGLCVGAGGYFKLKNTKADKAYWKGKKSFGQTSYYAKGKKNSHWMKVG